MARVTDGIEDKFTQFQEKTITFSICGPFKRFYYLG